MAVVAIPYTDIANLEAGSTSRAKINALGNAVADNSNELVSKLSQLDSEIDSINNDINSINNIISPAAMVTLGTSSSLEPQSFTPDISTKLTWFDTQIVSFGTDITYDLANQNITIGTGATGKYRFGGTITFATDINNLIQIELFVNAVASGYLNNTIGRGTGVSCTVNYYAIGQFSEGDIIDLRATYLDADSSTPVDITVQNSTVVFEKTPY
jgi:outer membrane murein-binding lipoprotein Lpp